MCSSLLRRVQLNEATCILRWRRKKWALIEARVDVAGICIFEKAPFAVPTEYLICLLKPQTHRQVPSSYLIYLHIWVRPDFDLSVFKFCGGQFMFMQNIWRQRTFMVQTLLSHLSTNSCSMFLSLPLFGQSVSTPNITSLHVCVHVWGRQPCMSKPLCHTEPYEKSCFPG